MTRNKALRVIANSKDIGELSMFFGHANKHVRHSARVKAYRLDSGSIAVESELKKISEALEEYDKKVGAYNIELARWRRGFPEPKEPGALEVSILWSARYIRKLQKTN